MPGKVRSKCALCSIVPLLHPPPASLQRAAGDSWSPFCQDGGKAKPLKKASGAKKELDDDDKAFQARGARLPPSLEACLWRSLLAIVHTPRGCPLNVVMTAVWPTLSRTCCAAAAPLEPPTFTRGGT